MPTHTFIGKLDYDNLKTENRLLKRKIELLTGAAQLAKETIEVELNFGPIGRRAFEKALKQLKDAGV